MGTKEREKIMVSAEERLRILKLIQDGKITAEEGIKLLDAIGGTSQTGFGRTQASSAVLPREPRWLRVKVTDTKTGKTKVNIRLPVNVLMAGAKMGARFSPEVEGLDMKKVMESIRAGETGLVLDVFDDQGGEHVEVYIE
jgi:hypothetical protein